MAFLVLQFTASLGYYVFSLLSFVIVSILLYVAGSILRFLLFYIKESVCKANRPRIAGTVFHQVIHFNTLHDFHTKMARKHGTYRLIAPFHNEIYTTDPANIMHILKTDFSKYSKGQYNCNVMKDFLGEGIFNVDGAKWLHQRKLASHEFSTKVLRDFSSNVFRRNAEKLVKKIAEAADATTLIDMQNLFMKSTLDSIFKVGFGVELNTLSDSNEFGSRFTEAFDECNSIMFWRFADPFWVLKRYLNIGSEAKLRRNLKVIDDFVFQLIRSKREQMKTGIEEKTKEDILSRFIIESKKDPEKMTDRYLRDIILNFLIAGKDSSANALSWFFYILCKHPLVQEKIAVEIREATRSEGKITNVQEFMGSLTEEALDKMQYLHAALNESLRLYPPLPMDGKKSDEDDILPDGFKVKKGDGVNYLPYAMGRMSVLWGDDAEDFRPERWLENGTFRAENPFKFIVFNAGPRICLGKEFAYRQMKIFAAVLLNFFKFKLEEESKNVTYKTMITLQMDKGLDLFAFQRLN